MSPPLTPESVAIALSERNARRVLAGCVEEPRSAKELSVRLGMPLATVYRQIHRLLALALLVPERSVLTPDGKKVDLYRSRVLEAHLDVTNGVEEVRWRVNDAVEAIEASS